MNLVEKENPLGTRPPGRLLFSLAVPAVIANVINALYNIVDQIFIGNGIGYLGNAATSVSFPLTTICMAIGLMTGLVSAGGFNLELGRKNNDLAKKYAGTAASMLVISGIIICIIVRLFLGKLLVLFGASEQILPFAKTYAGITSLGIPFLLFSTGTNPLVRADRSPTYSMAAIITGAVLNTVLDPIFIFKLNLGIAGAAWATVISQAVSAAMLALYFPRFKSVRFSPADFIPSGKTVLKICSLGINSFIFQSSNLIVQIVLNNSLRHYGEASVYGSDIPIAVAGIVIKINVIYLAFIIGLINGAQPICSYNYGAKKYRRVRDTVSLFIKAALIMSFTAFAVFEIFPTQIIRLFGDGSELYFSYASRFMRVYLFCIFVTGVQICSATFFPSIGKAAKGAMLSFAKQILFVIPLMLILPRFMGLDGVMFAQPIAYLLAFALAVLFLTNEMRHMPKEDIT